MSVRSILVDDTFEPQPIQTRDPSPDYQHVCKRKPQSILKMQRQEVNMIPHTATVGTSLKPCSCLEDEIGELELEVTGKWVDNGIGEYEFWGQRGYDSRMEFEAEGSGTVTLGYDVSELEVVQIGDKFSHEFIGERHSEYGDGGYVADFVVLEYKAEPCGGYESTRWQVRVVLCYTV